jgi:hypothetical protein
MPTLPTDDASWMGAQAQASPTSPSAMSEVDGGVALDGGVARAHGAAREGSGASRERATPEGPATRERHRRRLFMLGRGRGRRKSALLRDLRRRGQPEERCG